MSRPELEAVSAILEAEAQLERELTRAAESSRRASRQIGRAIFASTIAAAFVAAAALVGFGLFLHWADRGCPPGQRLEPSGITVDVTPYKAEPLMVCQP